MTNFDKQIADQQVRWRKNNIDTEEMGIQNGLKRPWILPENLWKEGLWEGIKESLPKYLKKGKVQRHKGCHNLKSSWMLCANLYFPFHEDKNLLAGFLNKYINDKIKTVDRIELEYAEGGKLNPKKLLGEPQGTRGANQTSPDVAFIVNGRKGLVLTENKYTEHSFYPCSGRKTEHGNPDIKRCLDIVRVLDNTKDTCYMNNWEADKRTNRKYWNFINISEDAKQTLKRCPAATAGYQLFRQQALAEGIAESGNYDFVISCVAYDNKNQTLISCLKSTGIDDFRTGWGNLFDGKAGFKSFSHQQWVDWVRNHDSKERWRDWLLYIEQRYGY
ncbi:hypothetical protein ACFL1G_02850 [Planctomycetota bacterium]